MAKKEVESICIRCGLKFSCVPSNLTSYNKKGICDICHHGIKQSNKEGLKKWI